MGTEGLPFPLSGEKSSGDAATVASAATPDASDTAPKLEPLIYQSYFCPEGKSPYDVVEWKTHHVILKDGEGRVIFEQEGVEAPATWSDRAVRIVAQKYFRGRLGAEDREAAAAGPTSPSCGHARKGSAAEGHPPGQCRS
jgi:ribonucleoside-diphosphate reductase alpha chain